MTLVQANGAQQKSQKYTIHSCMNEPWLTTNSTQNSGEKTAFSINNAGTNGYLPRKKLKFDLYFIPHTKVNFRTIEFKCESKHNNGRLGPTGKQARDLNEHFTKEGNQGLPWWSIYLAMQGIKVRSLVWEDTTCHGVTKPKCLEPMLCNKRSHCNEKPAHCNKEQSSLQWRVAPAATRESPGAATKTQCSQK